MCVVVMVLVWCVCVVGSVYGSVCMGVCSELVVNMCNGDGGVCVVCVCV